MTNPRFLIISSSYFFVLYSFELLVYVNVSIRSSKNWGKIILHTVKNLKVSVHFFFKDKLYFMGNIMMVEKIIRIWFVLL